MDSQLTLCVHMIMQLVHSYVLLLFNVGKEKTFYNFARYVDVEKLLAETEL